VTDLDAAVLEAVMTMTSPRAGEVMIVHYLLRRTPPVLVRHHSDFVGGKPVVYATEIYRLLEEQVQPALDRLLEARLIRRVLSTTYEAADTLTVLAKMAKLDD
jgi:hypothetical protein